MYTDKEITRNYYTSTHLEKERKKKRKREREKERYGSGRQVEASVKIIKFTLDAPKTLSSASLTLSVYEVVIASLPSK